MAGDGFAIPSVDLTTEGEVSGIYAAGFQRLAESAKAGCPVSTALSGTKITLEATLLYLLVLAIY